MSQVGGAFVTAVPAIPVGAVEAFAGSSAPNGWLLCDGTAVSRTTYSSLFSVVSTTFGVGNGSTTFNVPDLRGRVPMGAGTGTGGGVAGAGAPASGVALTARTLGAYDGDERLHAHTHTDSGHTHTIRVNSFAGDLQISLNNAGDGSFYSISDSGTDGNNAATLLYNTTNAANIQNNSQGGLRQNVQPSVILNYIIKWSNDVPRGGMTASWTPPIVTTLPVSPSFGDQVVYAADATNGVYWLLQYDASGTYPWKFIGGAPLQSLVSTQESTTNPAYVALTTAGPSVTCVLPGDYDVHIGASFNSGAGNDIIGAMSYLVGATSALDADAVWFQARGPGYNNTVTKTSRKTGVAASTALTARYKSPGSATMAFLDRFMRVTPIRVSA